MNWKFWKRPTVAFAFATAFCFVAGTDAFAVDQRYAKFDLTKEAHWDTTFTAVPGDTILFGFMADQVTVCVPSTSTATVQWVGSNSLLLSNSGGTIVNPRKGLNRFTSSAVTPATSSCYSYIGAPYCRGVVFGGAITGTMVLIADRVYK